MTFKQINLYNPTLKRNRKAHIVPWVAILALTFCFYLPSSSQEVKSGSSINIDVGANAFAIHNDDYGIFFGVGFEHYWLKPFSTEISVQTGKNVHNMSMPIIPEDILYPHDYVLITDVNYFSIGFYPRLYQELSDVIFVFADAGIGIESSKSSSTFVNQANASDEFLGNAKSGFTIYPGFHVGIKIIGEDISGSLYLGWEKIDLGRSMNQLNIAQTTVFDDYSKNTFFLQLGFKLSVPLRGGN